MTLVRICCALSVCYSLESLLPSAVLTICSHHDPGQCVGYLLGFHWNQLHWPVDFTLQAGYNYCQSQERIGTKADKVAFPVLIFDSNFWL